MFKAKHLSEIQAFMEKEGIPGRDGWGLPTSKKSFPDGGHYRIEIAGIERYSNMVTLIEEARNYQIGRASCRERV